MVQRQLAIGMILHRPKQHWLKNAALAVNIPERQVVPVMVPVGVTAVGAPAVKTANLLKSSMITAQTPVLVRIVHLVR